MTMWWVSLVICAIALNIQGITTQKVTHQNPRIYSLDIQSEIKMRFATTLVTSKVANPAQNAQEAIFVVTLPDAAFITKFAMEIDGVVYPGEVKEKESAKKQYQEAKERGQSAGHITKKQRETNKFEVAVNVAAQSKVTFNLTYQELLQRTKGFFEHVIYIDPGQVVEKLNVFVVVNDMKPITYFGVPPVSNDVPDPGYNSDLQEPLVRTGQPKPNTAYAIFTPGPEEQRRRSQQGISGKFVVRYDIEREQDAGNVLVVDGYFVHFFAPPDLEPIPKDALFILDRSGSMSGNKIRQVKKAMGKIMEDLHEGDRFGIISFSNDMRHWHNGLKAATAENIREATSFVTGVTATGGTNINGALEEGIRILESEGDESRSQVVVFLTDGQATVGESNNHRILSNVKQRNMKDYPVFCLAFGNDADFDLCKKVGLQNHGLGRKIYEDADAALQISGFYDEISVSVLRNITFQYLDDVVNQTELTSTNFNTLFKGTELVVAGKLDEEHPSLRLMVTAQGAEGNLDFTSNVDAVDFNEVPLTDDAAVDANAVDVFDLKESELLDPAEAKAVTEKIWAYLTIKQLLDEEAATSDTNKKESLKKRVTDLALKYQFVTPLTSMLVTKPDQSDQISSLQANDGVESAASKSSGQAASPARKINTRPRATRRRGRGGGGGGGGGGGYGGGGDPHFLVRLPGLERPLCFEVECEAKTFLRILLDPVSDLKINAAIIPSELRKKTNGKMKTYMGEIFIKAKETVIVVTSNEIILNSTFFTWNDGNVIKKGIFELKISNGGKTLHVTVKHNVVIAIRRHLPDNYEPVDYLNVNIENNSGLSKKSTGLLGQFVSTRVFLKRFEEKNGKTVGHLKVKHGLNTTRLLAKLHNKLDYVDNTSVSCWNANRHINGLIQGQKEDYLLTNFFS